MPTTCADCDSPWLAAINRLGWVLPSFSPASLTSYQATPVVSSNAPHYDTVIQYVVDLDPFIVEYMDTHVSHVGSAVITVL